MPVTDPLDDTGPLDGADALDDVGPHYDAVVVGAGPIGSATARHLAEQGASVLVVGPEEPAGFADHDGVWAGHYDQGRLCHVLEVPLATTLMALRSVRRFADLADRTGVSFTHAIESVAVMPEGIDDPELAAWFDPDRFVANARDLGKDVQRLGGAELAAAYPKLRFEAGHIGVRQHDALIVNPRDLTRAELAAATAAGAVLVRDSVVDVGPSTSGRRAVTTRGGQRWSAGTVIVATGASTNTNGFLPRPLAMEVFGATVTLVEVADPAEFDGYPGLMYLKAGARGVAYGGIVMPPLRYPDGKWYVKCAGDSVLANPLTTAADIGAWVRTGGVPGDIGTARALLAELMPDKAFGAAHTRPCLVSANHSLHPYIDVVDDGLVVATEGERGVMAADEVGRLTAHLAATGGWRDGLPRELFAARWLDPAG